MAVGAWVPLSTESSTVAREARYCDAEVQDVHIRERMFLARAQCEPHPQPLSEGRG